MSTNLATSTPNDTTVEQTLITVDEDGTLHGRLSEEVREQFTGGVFSAVYSEGTVVLQEVKTR